MRAFDPNAIVSTTPNRPMGVAAGVFLAVLALSACTSIPTAKDLLGMWASKAVVTSSGSTSETFCFAANGSVEWTTQVPGRTSRVRGTYKIAGDVLTVESPDLDTPVTLKAKMSLGKLELTSPAGSKQKYSRIPGVCGER